VVWPASVACAHSRLGLLDACSYHLTSARAERDVTPSCWPTGMAEFDVRTRARPRLETQWAAALAVSGLAVAQTALAVAAVWAFPRRLCCCCCCC
jgi:hypothetical protein